MAIPLLSSTAPPYLESPEEALSENSIQLTSEKALANWSKEEDRFSYQLFFDVVHYWKKQEITQYLVYGHINFDKPSHFSWEIVPFKKASNPFSRIYHQCKILLRTLIGGTKANPINFEEIEKFQERACKRAEITPPIDDPFCDPKVIENQLIYEGESIYLLYNYKPIGLGEEKLHFLLVPKRHRSAFTDLTEDEYLEIAEVTRQMSRYLSNTRAVKEGFFFHKTGKDAGQSVDHWHLHLIFTESTTEALSGRIAILKNMLFNSSPLKKEELKAKVSAFRKELIADHFFNKEALEDLSEGA